MPYLLKTTNICNYNCIYCENLGRKTKKHKSLREIEVELIDVKKAGYKTIRLSCNTDIRKDFIDILDLIRKQGMRIILETNARIFCYDKLSRITKKYIFRYEILLSFFDLRMWGHTHGVTEGIDQMIAGAKNLLKANAPYKVIGRIPLLNSHLIYINDAASLIKNLGITVVKLVLPFNLNGEGYSVSSIVEAVFNIQNIKGYLAGKNLKVIINNDLEYNPFIPENLDFYRTNSAQVNFECTKHKKTPKFSVVIPTYNRKKYLELVLKSFLEQQYPYSQYEIIIVDDGSTDGTGDMIKKLEPKCNLKYVYWPRPKKKIRCRNMFGAWPKFYNRVGMTRNIGIQHASGSIVLFNDSDIIVNSRCLQQHENRHVKKNNLVVRGLRMFLSKDYRINEGAPSELSELDNISTPEHIGREAKLHCNRHFPLSEVWQRFVTANLSIKKKYLEQIGGFDKDYVFWGFEDSDIGYRLGKLTLEFIWDTKIKVYHQHHSSESGQEMNMLYGRWLSTNIFYRKYLDHEAYRILSEVILRRLDNYNFQ